MEKQVLHIPNISCHHCVNAIKNELGDLEGVDVIASDVGDKTVTVQWENPATMDAIKKALKEINYPVQ